jgi:hypothetical protein
VLQALVEPPKPSEDVPPARLPTKEEKELIKLSLSLENIKMQSQQLQQQSTTMGDTVNAESMVIGEMGTASYLSAPASHTGNPSHSATLFEASHLGNMLNVSWQVLIRSSWHR